MLFDHWKSFNLLFVFLHWFRDDKAIYRVGTEIKFTILAISVDTLIINNLIIRYLINA